MYHLSMLMLNPMKMSFVQRNRSSWMASITMMTGSCFAGIPYKCFLRATIKNSEEFANAYSMKIHCRNPIGRMHSSVAMM